MIIFQQVQNYSKIDKNDYLAYNLIVDAKSTVYLRVEFKANKESKEIVVSDKLYTEDDALAEGIDYEPLEVMTAKDNQLNFKRKQELLLNLTPSTKLDKVLLNSACLYYLKQDFLKKQIQDNNFFDIILERYKKELNADDFEIYQNAMQKLKEKY